MGAAAVRDLSTQEHVAYSIRSCVRFSSANPEFNRLMIQVGKQDSWRMHWQHILAGGGALMFSLAPEVDRLVNVDVSNGAVIDRHDQMMVDFLLSRCSA